MYKNRMFLNRFNRVALIALFVGCSGVAQDGESKSNEASNGLVVRLLVDIKCDERGSLLAVGYVANPQPDGIETGGPIELSYAMNATIDDERRESRIVPSPDRWTAYFVFRRIGERESVMNMSGRVESNSVVIAPEKEGLLLYKIPSNRLPAKAQKVWLELHAPGGVRVFRSNEVEVVR